MANNELFYCGLTVFSFVVLSVLSLSCAQDEPLQFLPNLLHASCNVEWTFSTSCNDVNAAIAKQMKPWETEDCKNGGQKCIYHLTSRTSSEIKGTHETEQHNIDDITIEFEQDEDVCRVHGHSTSETWYAVFDYGTNYCNLHNLLTGSGMDKVSGYSEQTSNFECTQYTSANCEVC